jgi:uncharacterized protein YkwD
MALGGVSASLYNGILVVVGTDAPDQIVLDVQTPTAAWGRAPASPMLVVEGVAAFPLNQVGQVWVAGGGGNDAIAIDDGGRPVPLTIINAGDGDDVVLGGSGLEAIMGGAGDDIIVSRGGRDMIDPGTGHDWVNGKFTDPPPAAADRPPIAPVSGPAPSPTSTSPANPVPPNITTSPDLAAWASQIVALTNQQRKANGLPDLKVSDKLTQMAQIQADQMAGLNTMSHDLPNARYPDLQSRASAVGYKFNWLGENIAFNYPDPQGVMNGWMLSTGHRANILNASYTEIGVAVALNADGRPYFAQEFGQPAMS